MKHQLLINLHRVAIMLLVALSFTLSLQAQDDFASIDLTFTAIGDAQTVESVTVTNISHPEIEPITMSGTDVLRLVSSDVITPIENIKEAKGIAQPILTPNPSMGDGTLIFDAQDEGQVRVSIYNQSGMLLDAATLNVCKGRNTARIPSQGTGIFIVHIEGQGIKTSTRWICGGSKSFSGIALGGAAQWADRPLPMKYEESMQTRAAQVNEQFLEFHEGDILRFDGRSGELRTIMHMSPKVSGSVCIDLFRCQDANGYNYPIVRSGNMLWMLEDLRPVAMPGITRTGMVTLWKSKVDKEPAIFVSQGRAYYNLQAARMALPEGWHLPSVDEFSDYIFYGLHTSVQWPHEDFPVYTAYGIADFLKDRSYDWGRGYLREGLDSIHLQLRPNGYVDADGKVVGVGETGAWLLRNTIKHGHPATFEVVKSHHRLDFGVEHEKNMGFTVRGCCPAPTEYEAVLNKFFIGQDEGNPPMHVVNGPLGQYYTFGPERFSVFFDYGGLLHATDDQPLREQRSAILNKGLDDYNSEVWMCQKKQFVPLDVNGADSKHHLRKVTSQVNAYGYENVVYASWSQPFKVHLSPTISGSEGVVYISIFGDADHNHEMLVNKAPLLDADGSEYIWQMPTSGFSSDGPWTIEVPNGSYLSDFLYQHYARAFNINCIQDMTGDGVDEIVMNVGHTIAIFDGVTLRRIHQRSNFKSVCTRFDVADVNADGYEDIVVATSDAKDYTWMYIYDKGDIDQNPIYYQKTPIHSRYCDIKVGYMSGNKMPEIAILMRGGTNNSNGTLNTLNYYGNLEVLRMYYNSNNQLQANQILLTKVDCFTDRNTLTDVRGLTGNMNLVFGYFRGHSYNQDLIVGDGLWRWDINQNKPVYQFQMLPETRADYNMGSSKTIFFCSTISADAIVAVQTAKNDKESLMFFLDRYPYTGSTAPRTSSTLVERWLADDGKTVKTNWSLCSSLCGWGNLQSTRIMSTGNDIEELAHPVICKFADRDMTKHFEYVGHEQSLSEPIIYAVVAAAPYYTAAGYDNADTTWGKTESTSDSELKSDKWGGSVIVGYEYEFSMPFFSSVNAGVEFTAKVGASYSAATGEETVVSYGNSFGSGAEHQVLMKATLYDTYTYRIVDSGDPDDLGMTFRVSMPGTSSFINISLRDYVQMMGNSWDVAWPQDVLTSTPGDPWSYPSNYNSFPYAIRGNNNYPFLIGRIGGSEESQIVGTGLGSKSTRTISLEKYVSETKTVEFNVETELVGKVNGVKAGVGIGYGNSNETTRTIGSELNVSGTVPGVPNNAGPQFYWNLVWYYVRQGDNVYPVVNYVVSNKQRPDGLNN